jgi:hypothetical protein
MRRALWAGLGCLLLVVGGCALNKMEKVERTSRGPSAEDLFVRHSYAVNGRAPSFEEKRIWEAETEDRVFKYLRAHPELEQTTRYSDFRFWWQVTKGNTPAEVRVLLEEPPERTIDPARMAALAAKQWSALEGKATEAWVYPSSWVIFFDDTSVIEMVRRVPGMAPAE